MDAEAEMVAFGPDIISTIPEKSSDLLHREIHINTFHPFQLKLTGDVVDCYIVLVLAEIRLFYCSFRTEHYWL